MTLPAGSRLGVYEILEPLGAGGMGEVYRARDLKLGREVAIKILPEDPRGDLARVTRFEREARMLAAVNHPNIAAIYGAEEDGETRYIVMELVSGETLAQLLATGPLPVAEALRVGAQIAEALEVAHAKGVIHRDLKPANIKLTTEGKVKVLDFGLAKAMELPLAADMSRSPTLVMGDSRPGDIIGTPEFMSPEQARGKETDRRTDIWAFGCILYEMLTGRRAFTGETVPDAMAAILDKEPDWAALPQRTPQRVRDLLRVCLEKDPGRRLRDAGDARLELEATLAGLSGGAEAAIARRPFRWRAAAAAATAALLAIAAYLLLKPRAEPALFSGRHLAVLPFRNLTGSPDGDLWGLGMVETVSARLANVPGLQVVTPRATVEAVDADPNFVRVARRLGANTLLAGTLQRENERFRITYRLVDASGNQLAAAAIDGSELFALQDRVADGVVRDLRLRRGAQRTPAPTGLDTGSQQERYLEAVGSLQRYDKPDAVDNAVKLLESLAAERPTAPLVQAALGRAYLARFNLTRDPKWVTLAAEACDRARQLHASSPEVDITLGELALRTGKDRDAVAAYQRALAAQPSNFEATLGLARAFDAGGDPSRAEQTYHRAIRLQPAYFGGYSKLAAFYYTNGRLGEATAMFRKVTELTPDNARAFANLGAAYLAQGSFEQALAEFRKSVALAPNDLAWSNIGTAQYYLGRYSDAATAYEKSVRLLPDHYENWGNLGDAYRQLPGRESKAVEACEKSIALARIELATNPRDATARSYLALCLAKTGKTEEAEAEARRSLEAAPAGPEILYNAAIVSNRAGKTTDALDRLRKALRAGYNAEITRREPELANLRPMTQFQEILRTEKRKGS